MASHSIDRSRFACDRRVYNAADVEQEAGGTI
jgi:hypothetical protein